MHPIRLWRTFFFDKRLAYPLGAVRMAFGAVMVVWSLSLLPDLSTLFGPNGTLHSQPGGLWGLLGYSNSQTWLVIAWLALFGSSIALMLGWQSRIAALAVFLLILSFERRDPYVFNSGDLLLRIEALFLVLAPCGAALSLDQRRKSGKFWDASEASIWTLRLFQLQMSLVYLSTLQSKLSGTTWPGGTAASYSMRLPDLAVLSVPSFVWNNALLINVITWGTLVLEVSLALLVWNPRLRPWVLGAGVVLHLSIQATLAVAFFSVAMFVLYIAFLSPDTIRDLPARVGTLRQRKVFSPSD